ncbi:hypothetical protein JCM10450v2_004910 [Rhodotorula kratochvilovae]
MYTVPLEERADVDELKRRQLIAAVTDPLERGTVLAWMGASLHPDSLVPQSAVSGPSDALLRRRAPNPALISSTTSPAFSSTPWQLRLVDPIQHGPGHPSQIWRVRASQQGEDRSVDVVLKFYDPDLALPDLTDFPNVFFSRLPTVDLEQKERKEARAYELLRDLQGSAIPCCYGFYRFTLPRGDEVVGVVLEDLTEVAISVPNFVQRELSRGALSQDKVDALIYGNFDLFRRLLNRDILHCTLAEETFLDRSSAFASSPSFHFVWTGLGRLYPPEQLACEDLPQVDEREQERMHLITASERSLAQEAYETVPEEMYEAWADRERAENRLQLACLAPPVEAQAPLSDAEA